MRWLSNFWNTGDIFNPPVQPPPSPSRLTLEELEKQASYTTADGELVRQREADPQLFGALDRVVNLPLEITTLTLAGLQFSVTGGGFRKVLPLHEYSLNHMTFTVTVRLVPHEETFAVQFCVVRRMSGLDVFPDSSGHWEQTVPVVDLGDVLVPRQSIAIGPGNIIQRKPRMMLLANPG